MLVYMCFVSFTLLPQPTLHKGEAVLHLAGDIETSMNRVISPRGYWCSNSSPTESELFPLNRTALYSLLQFRPSTVPTLAHLPVPLYKSPGDLNFFLFVF